MQRSIEKLRLLLVAKTQTRLVRVVTVVQDMCSTDGLLVLCRVQSIQSAVSSSSCHGLVT